MCRYVRLFVYSNAITISMISLSLSLSHTYTICVKYLLTTGSAISNGRKPKSGLGRVFNSILGHIATVCSKCMVSMQPLLKLKTRPRVCPVS